MSITSGITESVSDFCRVSPRSQRRSTLRPGHVAYSMLNVSSLDTLALVHRRPCGRPLAASAEPCTAPPRAAAGAKPSTMAAPVPRLKDVVHSMDIVELNV